jgi:very-short-patch-repair endonuclease
MKRTTRYTKEEIIKNAINVHGYTYDYSLINYVNSRTPIKIICKKHGIFEQTTDNHINKKSKCPNCSNRKRYKTTDIIKKFNDVHNKFYDYNKVNYINRLTNVIITCPIHGDFVQQPRHHLNGHGCPSCNQSKGEKLILEYLEINNINFETQKKFNGCKNKKHLPFDFYLPDYNMCIEFDGEQHYKPYRFEKDDTILKIRQKRDNIKNQYCIKNNIKLIRIPYWDYNKIHDILSMKLN